MVLELWLSLVLICVLGAMSPGPSLALVVRNTLLGGQRSGLVTAISHGIAIGLYAAIVLTGIGVIIVQSPIIFQVVQYSGAAFLLFLAYKALTSKASNVDLTTGETTAAENINAWRDGFLIAFLNPKIAMFFLALFSQFIDANASFEQQLIMVLTVGGIDTIWYCLVAFGLSRGPVLQRLRSKTYIIDKVTGVVLILLAIRVVV
ncbi:LysE family translocator [Thalassotalea psychrophila]|uniref:LysE family translocator n=1 Tax=Thalassotalea psychrophila TaxID=3065647 RepID=A0ABY9TZ02_9GAMM|nr:LysE family translocator [Colwelliaceae bacterium SQ149]